MLIKQNESVTKQRLFTLRQIDGYNSLIAKPVKRIIGRKNQQSLKKCEQDGKIWMFKLKRGAMKILMRTEETAKWQTVKSAAYKNEAVLQALLAGEPSLINVDEVCDGAGSLVVAVREFPLEIGYVDIVGFTADGDIAVVECKLAANEESKRKVIGQLFEYGANLWGMNYETLDQKILLCSGKNLADLMRENMADPEKWDEEAFRRNIKAALETGNFILIIVVDEIREELSRIVRFINDAGRPAFSFAALEMRRYHHDNVEMLVPHVFSATPKPKSISTGSGTKRKWDQASFLAELANRHIECVEPAKKILAWVNECHDISRVYWGEGDRSGGFVPIINYNGKDHQLFALYTYASLEVYFQYYRFRKPFDKEEKRLELLERLNHISGIRISKDKINRRPSISLNLLNDAQVLQELLQTFEWIIQEIKSVK